MPLPIFTLPAADSDSRMNAGGLNSTSGPLNVASNESSSLQNIDFDKFGSILKRNGSLNINTTAANGGAVWTSLYEFRHSNGNDYLIGTAGNQFLTWAAGFPSGNPTNSTGVVTITAGKNNLWQWTRYRDLALGANGVDANLQWSGSGNAAAMTVTAGIDWSKWIAVFNNYILIANISLSSTKWPYRMYWSAFDDSTTWNTADFNDFSWAGKEITGLKVLGDRLVIFTDRAIVVGFFTGDADVPFQFQKTNAPVGCMSGYSIQEVEGGLIFLASDGLYYFDGINAQKMSYRVQTTLDNYNQSRFPQCSSMYHRQKNRYWAAFSSTSTQTTHDEVLLWDSYNNAFSRYAGLTPNCMTTFVSAGEERIYFGDYAGWLYRADTGTDDYPAKVKTAINAYYYTKWFDFSELVNVKATPEIVIYYEYAGGTMNFSWSFDLNNNDQYTVSFSTAQTSYLWDTAIWDTALWADSGGSLYRIDLIGRGRLVRYKFANPRVSELMKVYGFGNQVYAETVL